MAAVVPDILAKIVQHKFAELEDKSAEISGLKKCAATRPPARDFRQALLSNPPAVISEIKQASPSKGILSSDFRPAEIASKYERGGAAALSVLTDEKFFRGSLQDLEAARSAVKIPVLRKDFTVSEIHVLQAAAHGADAILLIAAILDVQQMRAFRQLASEHQMASLVEVHNEAELEAALASGAEIIGVNNRNLHNFEVDVDLSLRLVVKMPAGVVKVAESGIHSREDVSKLRSAGYDAFLVGEHLMKSGDPEAALRALRS